ncbi:MAG TPA: LLM class F420-dependent oxidoreductase [Pseudomonadales bacterium]
MKLGFMCGLTHNGLCTIDQYIAEVQQAEAMGFEQAWMGQVFSTDAIGMMTLLGRETKTIHLGTAVTPIYPRHPTALALQALTASAASDGRFDLGIGVSHQLVMEDMFGLSYERPAARTEEYLRVLMPLLRGEQCDFDGNDYRVHAKMTVPGAHAVPVLVAALGERMLRIAGTLADGTSTWMTGPNTLAHHIIPTITQAARDAGRPAPRIVASFPIVLTDDTSTVREVLTKKIGVYGYLPSYKAMLEREGTDNPVDIAMVGNEAALLERLDHLRDIGVTDFNAFCIGTDNTATARTMAFLASIKAQLAGH